MIKLDYSKALLSAEQIAAFAPKAEEAQKALEAGTCAGNDFLGWIDLPVDYDKADRSLRKLVGKSGKAVTNLSLAGKAKINGRIYDVISMNSYIDKGSNIKVVEIKDNNIVVRKWFE